MKTEQRTFSFSLLEMSSPSPSGQVDGEPQRTLQPRDPGSVVRAHAGMSVLRTAPKHKSLLTRSVILVWVVKLAHFNRCLLIGQPPGALLHALPRSGGGSHFPVAREGGEDSREQAGARAEAEHHLLVLGQLRTAGPLPPPGAG